MDTSRQLAQCLEDLQQAVAALGGSANDVRLPGIAELIIQSMTGPWRSFHTPEHIFEVGQGGTPVEVIAALFHDLVYVQVDAGIHVNLARHVAPYVREGRQGLVIDPVDANDPALRMTMDLFGFAPGHVLSPFAGQNEFLSALVAVKALDGILPWPDLARIAACIEATIPFRADGPQGSPSEVLAQRLQQLNERMGLGLDAAACEDTVRMAVRVANRDIGNFSSEDPGEFLNNTWNLIPETNHDLANANTYTVQGYRTSLQKMEGFLGFLQPEVVFRRHADEPSAPEHERRLALTRRNLEVARMYLRVKLVSIALIEALSLRLGQEVSLASIMGKLPIQGDHPIRLERHLPPVTQPYAAQGEQEATVMALLEKGRSAESLHDARHSPVASYLVKVMGMPATLGLLVVARDFFAGKANPEALLSACDPAVLQDLQQAAIEVFRQRMQALTQPLT
jgi:hypothetical protein